MFEGIDSYILKNKFSELNSNVLFVRDAVEKLQHENSGIHSIELPNRPLDSVLLFLQTPMNMEKYLVAHSDLIRERKRKFASNDNIKKYADLKKSNRYLFSWDEIPGKDSRRFIEFLKQKYNIGLVQIGNIEKSLDGKTIKVNVEKNEPSLSLNNEKTNMNIKFADGKTDDFMVKDENGKLNIYKISFPKEIPELLIFENLNETEKKELCERLSFKIKRFTEFMRAFFAVDEDIKPIMLYYSSNYFLTFLSDVQLHFKQPTRSHGLSGTKNLEIKREGTFARIVDGFFALDKPTLFSPWKEKGIVTSEGLWGSKGIENDHTIHIKAVKKLINNKYNYTQMPKISLSELIYI